MTTVEIDVTDDESIQAAVKRIENEFGMLDGTWKPSQRRTCPNIMSVLVNNAGIASVPSQDLQAQRASYNQMLNTNVTSVANVSLAFMPLLTAQSSTRCYKPRIINISSGRASLTRSTTGKLPPTASIPYSVSKVALNALTIEMQKSYPEVMFYVANPGHCKTQLNGFKGLRDPLEGARIVTELVQGDYEFGFWEAEYASGPVTRVPW